MIQIILAQILAFNICQGPAQKMEKEPDKGMLSIPCGSDKFILVLVYCGDTIIARGYKDIPTPPLNAGEHVEIIKIDGEIYNFVTKSNNLKDSLGATKKVDSKSIIFCRGVKDDALETPNGDIAFSKLNDSDIIVCEDDLRTVILTKKIKAKILFNEKQPIDGKIRSVKPRDGQ